MGRQTNVKNVFEKRERTRGRERKREGEGGQWKEWKGRRWPSAFTLFMTMLHILFSQNNPSNHCSKKRRTESRMPGDLSKAALLI